MVFALGDENGLAQAILQKEPIGEFGQGIVQGLMLQFPVERGQFPRTFDDPLFQVFLQRPDFGFGLLAFRDVAHDGDKQSIRAVGQFPDGNLHGKGVTILAAAYGFMGRNTDEGRSCRRKCSVVMLEFAEIGLIQQGVEIGPRDLRLRISEHLQRGLVHRFDEPVFIDGDDAVHYVVHDGEDALLAGGDGLATGHQFMAHTF